MAIRNHFRFVRSLYSKNSRNVISYITQKPTANVVGQYATVTGHVENESYTEYTGHI